MKLLFVLLPLATLASAETPWPSEKEIASPNSLSWQEATVRNIPEEIRAELSEGFAVGPGAIFAPPRFSRFDLNHDGDDELFLESSEPFSGGPMYAVYTRQDNQWRQIATLQGGFSITSTRHNGFYQIESWTRAGGGEFTRVIDRFDRGSYRTVRLEDWRGTDTDEGFEFVASREPQQNETEN